MSWAVLLLVVVPHGVEDAPPIGSEPTSDAQPSDADAAAWVKDVPVVGERAAEAVPRLIDIATATDQPDGLRIQAMLKVARVGRAASAAVPPLIELADEPAPIGRAALKALVQFGTVAAAAEPLFRDRLGDPRTRPLAIEGLVELAPVSGSALRTVSDLLARDATREPALRALPSSSVAVRSVLDRSLQRLLDDHPSLVAPLLVPTVDNADRLLDLVAFQEGLMRDEMAATLAAMGPLGIDRLRRLLRLDDEDLAATALRALRDQRLDRDDVRPLLASESAAVRAEAALQLLGRDEAASDGLLDALAGNRSLAVDVAAALASRPLPDAFVDRLRTAASEPRRSRQFRQLAVRVLAARAR